MCNAYALSIYSQKAWACLFLSLGSRQAFVEKISIVHAFLFVGKRQSKTPIYEYRRNRAEKF